MKRVRIDRRRAQGRRPVPQSGWYRSALLVPEPRSPAGWCRSPSRPMGSAGDGAYGDRPGRGSAGRVRGRQPGPPLVQAMADATSTAGPAPRKLRLKGPRRGLPAAPAQAAPSPRADIIRNLVCGPVFRWDRPAKLMPHQRGRHPGAEIGFVQPNSLPAPVDSSPACPLDPSQAASS